MGTLIKICGITNIDDALYAAGLNVWALGFVFAESPRKISQDNAKNIIAKLPPYIARVGVFVNEKVADMKGIVESCGLDMVQLHGDETPETCNMVKTFAKVIKAVRIKHKQSLNAIREYAADLYLLDAYSDDAYGGTGKSFNWDLAAVEAGKYADKIILSGGLNPQNIVEAIKKIRPYAVDVSSGVESAPGKKDNKLVRDFVSKVQGL